MGGLLFAGTLGVFWRTTTCEFVNYDDDRYVVNNPPVRQGLTVEGVRWAFTHFRSNNYHPLTWLSHALDCQLYGVNPAGHHLTSVLLHALNAALLFLSLRQISGDMWPSALVAAVFALHPLRVESVAWIAERKDVLSGLFFMLTLGVYGLYARKPFGLWRYLSVVLLFGLGLLCKPMLVTLPAVLLLLDYWPLGRWGDRVLSWTSGRLLVEKLPLVVLSAVSCGVTVWAQGEALRPIEEFPLSARLSNALVSYVSYLGQMIYPAKLAVFYPYRPGGPPLWHAVAAAVFLAGMTAGVWMLRRRCAYLVVGWLWYLVMLLPVIGLVQVGSQAMADRYTYLPQIGLCLGLAWGAVDPARRWRSEAKSAFAIMAGLLILLLAGRSWLQTDYWSNSETLMRHALDCAAAGGEVPPQIPGLATIYNNLSVELARQGKADQSLECLQMALTLDPHDAIAHCNMGCALMARGMSDQAIVHFRQALAFQPDYAVAHVKLGTAMALRRNWDEAIVHFQRALELNLRDAEVFTDLGDMFVAQGRTDEAIARYREALRFNPQYANAYRKLGHVLASEGQSIEAAEAYRKALEISPQDATILNNLGRVLVDLGAIDEAIARYREALKFNPQYAEACNNLSVAFARQGKADESLECLQMALTLDPQYAIAHCNMGSALMTRGMSDQAIVHFRQALTLQPDYAVAHVKLGKAMALRRNWDEAIVHFQRALDLNPRNAEVLTDLGDMLVAKGRTDEAIAQYQKAIDVDRQYAVAYNRLGELLHKQGKLAKSISCFQTALSIKPEFIMAENNLASVFLDGGQLENAVATWRDLLERQPDNVAALNSLAWVQATAADPSLRRGEEALRRAQRAAELTGWQEPAVLDTLAAALAECGRFGEAVETAQQALDRAITAGNASLAESIGQRLALYQADTVFRDPRLLSGSNSESLK